MALAGGRAERALLDAALGVAAVAVPGGLLVDRVDAANRRLLAEKGRSVGSKSDAGQQYFLLPVPQSEDPHVHSPVSSSAPENTFAVPLLPSASNLHSASLSWARATPASRSGSRSGSSEARMVVGPRDE